MYDVSSESTACTIHTYAATPSREINLYIQVQAEQLVLINKNKSKHKQHIWCAEKNSICSRLDFPDLLALSAASNN